MKIKANSSYIFDSNVDVLMIGETWLTPVVGDEIIKIEGYILFRRREEEERGISGGGAWLYIRDCLNNKILES